MCNINSSSSGSNNSSSGSSNSSSGSSNISSWLLCSLFVSNAITL